MDQQALIDATWVAFFVSTAAYATAAVAKVRTGGRNRLAVQACGWTAIASVFSLCCVIAATN